MVTMCLAGDGHPLGVTREGCQTLLCRDHIVLAETLETVDGVDRVDHIPAVVTWSFSHGSGVGVG